MEFYVTREDTELNHHGIKGQKWGVRRFQDYDGRRLKSGEMIEARKLRRKREKTDPAHIIHKIASMTSTVGLLMSVNGLPQIGLPVFTISMGVSLGVEVWYNNKIASRTKTDFTKKDGPVEKVKDMKKLDQPESIDDSLNKVNIGKPKLGSGCEVNCASCSVALDMRQKGYDVRARRQPEGMTNEEIAALYKGGKQFNHYSVGYDKQMSFDQFNDELAKDGGKSGIVTFDWPGGSGHAIYYQKKGDEYEFYDGQQKKKSTALDNYFLNCEGIAYLRTDNLKMTDDVGGCVVSVKDHRKQRT